MITIPYDNPQECRRLAKRAHRILDYAFDPRYIFPDGTPQPNAPVYVKTPRFGWHHATKREKELITKKEGITLW